MPGGPREREGATGAGGGDGGGGTLPGPLTGTLPAVRAVLGAGAAADRQGPLAVVDGARRGRARLRPCFAALQGPLLAWWPSASDGRALGAVLLGPTAACEVVAEAPPGLEDLPAGCVLEVRLHPASAARNRFRFLCGSPAEAQAWQRALAAAPAPAWQARALAGEAKLRAAEALVRKREAEHQSRATALDKALAAARGEAAAGRTHAERLGAELEELRADNRAKTGRFAALEHANARLAEETKAQAQARDLAARERDRAEQARQAKVEAELGRLRASHGEALRGEEGRRRAAEARAAALESERDDLRAAAAALRAEGRQLAADLGAAREALDAFETISKEAGGALQLTQERASALKVAEAEARATAAAAREQLGRSRDENRALLQELDAEAAGRRKADSAAEAAHHRQVVEASNHLAVRQALEQAAVALRKEKEEREAEARALAAAVDEAAAERTTLRDRATALEHEVAAGRAEAGRLQGALELARAGKDRERAAHIKEIAALQARLEELEGLPAGRGHRASSNVQNGRAGVQVSGPGSEEEEELDGDPPGLRALAPAGPPEGSSEEEDGRAEDEGRRRGQASPDRMALGYEGLLDAYRKEVDLNHSLHARLQAVHGRVKVLCRVKPAVNAAASCVSFPEVRGRGRMEAERRSNLVAVAHRETTWRKEPRLATKVFSFHRVLRPHAKQSDVFRAVEESLQGRGATLFLFGQPGAGKAFTLLGPRRALGDPAADPAAQIAKDAGILPRLLHRLLSGGGATAALQLSVVEVYLGSVRDLVDGGVELRGAEAPRLCEVRTLAAAMELLLAALARRSVAPDAAGRPIPRSHLVVRARARNRAVTVIDLAAGENVKQTRAAGRRFQEAVSINRSLSALGRVLELLAASEPEGGGCEHVPFREARLTHLLRDDLVGGAEIQFLVCLAAEDSEGSLKTLAFAQRLQSLGLNWQESPHGARCYY